MKPGASHTHFHPGKLTVFAVALGFPKGKVVFETV